MLGEDSTEDNDHSSDEDYHLSDEDKPKRRHRGKPSWAAKSSAPVKKIEYAADRKMKELNGLAAAAAGAAAGGTVPGNSSCSTSTVAFKPETVRNNHDTPAGSAASQQLDANRTSATAAQAQQHGGSEAKPSAPRGGSFPRPSGTDDDIEKVEDLVSFVVHDDT